MRQLAAAVLIATGGTAGAADWRALTGDEIRTALADQTVIYAESVEAEQSFFESGRTRYTFGTDRWGWWEVREGMYCSLWPPSDEWECFDVAVAPDGAAIRFIGAAGDTVDGTFAR